MSKKTLSRAALDNRANQLNPQHATYRSSRGQTAPPTAMPQAPAPTRVNSPLEQLTAESTPEK